MNAHEAPVVPPLRLDNARCPEAVRAARTAASSVSGVSRAASRTSLLMLQDRRSAPQGRCVQGRCFVFSLRDERNVVQQLMEGQRHT